MKFWESGGKALEKYVKYGGFAGSYVYENDEDKIKYISNVLNVVVLKDIMKKMALLMNLQINRRWFK